MLCNEADPVDQTESRRLGVTGAEELMCLSHP